MARKTVTEHDWTKFQKQQAARRKDLSEKADKAVDVADQFTEPVEIVPKRETPRGDRRRNVHQSWVRTPINGYSQIHSDIARHVIGLKYANNTIREACASAAEKFDRSKVTIERLYYDKQELFDLAEKELVENAMREYHQNLWVIRTALSQAGHLAVNTLMDILNDPDATPNVKSKSAIAVLKMLDVDGSANANPNERIALESLKLVRDTTVANLREDDSYVVNVPDEVEDAEYVEEDDGEVGTNSEL